ncbi:MAG: FprA family A-type flavoprotein [Spirochaetales bacterium]
MQSSLITEGIYRLSAHIHTILFEGIWPLPQGMTMNSYIVQGKDIAIIDGVCGWDGVPETLFQQFDQLGLSVGDIRYVVLNHMEPDHTGWLEPLKKITRGFELVATPRALRLAKSFFGLDETFCTLHPVKSGDRIDLGRGKVLQFEEIPNVHWPETMATYEQSTQTLFSCDAFGSFGAVPDSTPSDDLLSEKLLTHFEQEAIRYYANIVAAFYLPVLKAIEKLRPLPIRILAPGHGLVWKKDPGRIITLYQRLAEQTPAPKEKGITLLWTGPSSTLSPLIGEITQKMHNASIPLYVHRVPPTHVSYILSSILRSSVVILGLPPFVTELPSPLAHILDDLGRKKIGGRTFFCLRANLQTKNTRSSDLSLLEQDLETINPFTETAGSCIEEEIAQISRKYQVRWEVVSYSGSLSLQENFELSIHPRNHKENPALTLAG